MRAAPQCFHPERTSDPHPWAAALSLLWKLSLKRCAKGLQRLPYMNTGLVQADTWIMQRGHLVHRCRICPWPWDGADRRRHTSHLVDS